MFYDTTLVNDIKTIFLDSGKTLRIVDEDPNYQKKVRLQIRDLIGIDEAPEDLFKILTDRYKTYKRMVRGTLLQVSETELWTRWMLPDLSANKIAPLASQLTRLWHERNGRHVSRPDVKPTIIELHRRGYILGILANAASTLEIPEWLDSDGLRQYIKVIILSSMFGRRKPDVHIFFDAAYEAGANPVNCAYVGDDPSIDIKGARQAGFGMILILNERGGRDTDLWDGRYKPDGVIRRCSDLLEIFPHR